ncbi:MAG: DMT family transporter [Desulfobacteraceae bacterium]|nr:DMT family transporter [Desulfobacteraceae bacterium]
MENNEMTFGVALYTIFLCVLFGANAVAIKYSLMGLGLFTTAGVRFGTAAILIFLWARYKKIPLKLKGKQIWQMILVSSIFSVQLCCFYNGLARTTASHGTLIANLLPFVILILAHFFIPGDTITWKKFSGICLGFAGVLFLLLDEPNVAGDIKQGDMIIMIAVLLWGCSAVIVKSIISDYNPMQITIYPMICCAPIYLICGLLFDDPMIIHINTGILTALFYQTFITAAFGFVAWNSLLQRFGATSLHSFIFIMPLAGVFFGVLILGEPITVNLLASILFIVTGIIVVNMRITRKSM